MTKLSTILLGASLVFGTAAFAAQADKATKPATSTEQPAAKKKVATKHRKHKKATTPANAAAPTTPAPASTPKK
jgi:hypothetical protein